MHVKKLLEAKLQYAHNSKWKALSIKEGKKPFNAQAQRWAKFSTTTISGAGLATNKDHFVYPTGERATGLDVISWREIDSPQPHTAKLTGGSGSVTDLKFNNFVPSLIACSSQSGVIGFWDIASDTTNQKLNVLSTIASHVGTRVNQMEWNPLVESCLASAGNNGVVALHDVEKKKSQREVNIGGPVISISWALSGNLVAYVKKKNWGYVDIRNSSYKVNVEEGHTGGKPMQICSIGAYNDHNYVVTSGFGKEAQRELKIWDSRNATKHLDYLAVDKNVGSITMHYDQSTQLLYTVAKGDTRGHVFDLTEKKLWHINGPQGGAFPVGGSVRYFAFMPRRFVDTTSGEQGRFVGVVEVGELAEVRYSQFYKESRQSGVENIPFIQGDYPDVIGGTPLYKFNPWLTQEEQLDASKVLRSLDPEVSHNANWTPPEAYRVLANLGVETPGNIVTNDVTTNMEIKKTIEDKMLSNIEEMERIEQLVEERKSSLKDSKLTSREYEKMNQRLMQLNEAVKQLKRENKVLKTKYNDLLRELESTIKTSFNKSVLDELTLLRKNQEEVTKMNRQILQDGSMEITKLAELVGRSSPSISDGVGTNISQQMEERNRLLVEQKNEILDLKANVQSIIQRVDDLSRLTQFAEVAAEEDSPGRRQHARTTTNKDYSNYPVAGSSRPWSTQRHRAPTVRETVDCNGDGPKVSNRSGSRRPKKSKGLELDDRKLIDMSDAERLAVLESIMEAAAKEIKQESSFYY